MAIDEDVERDKRAKDRALAKRDSYVARIKAIYATARLASDDASMAPQLLAASTRLDNLLAGFEVEDSAVFDAYCVIDMLREYTTDVPVEVNGWVDYIRAIVSRYHVQPAPSPGVTLT